MKIPERTMRALRWITGILEDQKIPYHVTGGLAAKIYGSPRDVNDIDIEIPDEHLLTIVALVKDFVTYGPERFKDERWDLQLMMLNYHGQDIDNSGAQELQICDARTGEWVAMPSSLDEAVMTVVEDMTLPLMPKEKLAAYKKMLSGDHQRIDIEALERLEA